jgi:PncC family amidohydrolase
MIKMIAPLVILALLLKACSFTIDKKEESVSSEQEVGMEESEIEKKPGDMIPHMMNIEESRGAEGVVDEKIVRKKYADLTKHLIAEGITITTMESCTAGQIATLITDTEGGAAVLKGAFVTYSNEAKIAQGVPRETIEKYGVYSAETAAAMAKACRDVMHADIGIGVTGSFGNVDPNNEDSLPGEVYFAIADKNGIRPYHCTLPTQPTRLLYKLYISEVIVDQLSQLK